LKFGDVVTAVASSFVIFILILFPLEIALVPALGLFWGLNVSELVSILLSALIVGYIFAAKIWEARMGAITKIIVLSAVLVMFLVSINAAALADWTPWVKETYLEANPTATLSTLEWYIVEGLTLTSQIFWNVVIVLALGFIGLYVGSMLKRPVKSGK